MLKIFLSFVITFIAGSILVIGATSTGINIAAFFSVGLQGEQNTAMNWFITVTNATTAILYLVLVKSLFRCWSRNLLLSSEMVIAFVQMFIVLMAACALRGKGSPNLNLISIAFANLFFCIGIGLLTLRNLMLNMIVEDKKNITVVPPENSVHEDSRE